MKLYTDIKNQIIEDWAYFESDEDRAVQEFADGLVPIYSAKIALEWAEMDMEFDDYWQGTGFEPNQETNITTLMKIDLYFYYESLIHRALTEIQRERELV